MACLDIKQVVGWASLGKEDILCLGVDDFSAWPSCRLEDCSVKFGLLRVNHLKGLFYLRTHNVLTAATAHQSQGFDLANACGSPYIRIALCKVLRLFYFAQYWRFQPRQPLVKFNAFGNERTALITDRMLPSVVDESGERITVCVIGQVCDEWGGSSPGRATPPV
jgi:hypothetical protein